MSTVGTPTSGAFRHVHVHLLAPRCAGATAPASPAAHAQKAPAAETRAHGRPDLDRRFASSATRPSATQRRADRDLGADLGKDVQVGWSPAGTAHSVVASRGALTARSAASPDAVARGYLADHPELFGLSRGQVKGLELTSHDSQSGATFLRYQQRADGHEVYGADALVTVDRAGRVLIAGGNLVPDAGSAPAASLDAEDAVAITGANVAPGQDTTPGRHLGTTRGTQRFANTLAVPDYDRAAPVAADLVTVATSDGPRTAWRVLADRASDASYVTLVDARSGEVLLRTNQVSSDAEGTVYTDVDPDHGTRSVVPFTGWVSSGGQTTSGNNVNAYQDAAGDDAAQSADQPQKADQHFDYTWGDTWGHGTGVETDLPLSGDDRDAVVTQLFYYSNWYHDYAYGLGFDENARNFQNDNFGKGGTAGDAVEAESDANFTGNQCDSGGTPIKCLNNANFTTNGAEGNKPRMQMYVGSTTTPGGAARYTQRANNRDTIVHEYSHGISGRIISNTNLQGGAQSQALGEGWSDAFATSINNDPVYGEYSNADYTKGIRSTAYDKNTLKYSNLAGTEEHNNGEIWAEAMWEARAALIGREGQAAGKDDHERTMMVGLKNTLNTPSFHDARTGYLMADAVRHPTADAAVGANNCLLWKTFADNELGVTASPDPDTATDGAETISTATPDRCKPTAAIAAVPSTPEGTTITFDSSASTIGGDPGDNLSYAWDLDGDGTYTDSTLAAPKRAYGDNGSHTVGLQVTNGSGYTATTTTTFTTTNVNPTVSIDLSDLAGMKEGDTRTVKATFSDPGWLDTYAGNVALGTSYLTDVTPTTTVTTSGGQGTADTGGATPDQGTASASVTYGDNGSYSVTVRITDDDSGSGTSSANASVANVAPSVSIDGTGTQSYNGIFAFILKAGQNLTVPASSSDPGSDDLTFTWDWDGPALSGETPTSVTDLVNAPATDPALSPQVKPRTNVTTSATHAFSKACLYSMQVKVTDDDAGSSSADAKVVITGNGTEAKGHGWWLNQYRPKGNTFTPATLQCYLDIVNYFSLVFSEKDPANTRAQAELILQNPAKSPAPVIFDQQALGAWLNFANGSVRLNSPVDSNGDGVNDSTFGAVMLHAEQVRVNPASTSAQIKAQKDVVERISTQSRP